MVEKDSDEYRDVGCREHIVLVRRREKGRFEEKEGETTIQESKLRRLPRAGYRIDLSEPAKAPGTTRIPSYSLFVAHLARKRAGYARHACTTSSVRYNLQVVDRCASSSRYYTALKFEIRDVCISTSVASRKNVRWKKTVESPIFLTIIALLYLSSR